MSGYGRGVAVGDHVRISFEARSVNHRYCRIGMHLPAELGFFEAAARKQVAECVDRGKVDLAATIGGPKGLPEVELDHELAASYKRALVKLAEELDIEPRIDLALLTGFPGVVVSQVVPQVDPDRDVEVARQALAAALAGLDRMREAEGEHLAADISQRFEIIDGMVDRIAEMTTDLPHRYRDLISARIESLLEETGEVDPTRLAQEVAYYADRSDITEELVRMRSHTGKAAVLIDRGGPVGRSLDFLLQEMHREVNTLGAKAKIVEIGGLVVDLKSELERVREQVQNVE